MTDGNDVLIIEMIDIFTTQVEEFWIEMDELLKNKDYDSLGKLAHKAKSSVAILGMIKLSNELKSLELYCAEQKHMDLYPEIVSNFRSECLIAVKELQEYKKLHSL